MRRLDSGRAGGPECHFAGRARCETLRSSLASSHSLQPVGGMSVASTADVRAVLVPLCRAQRWNAAGCYEPSLTCWWRPGGWRLARCRRRFLNTARGAAAPAGCASLCWCCRSGSSHRERGCRCGRHRRWRRRAQQRKSRSGRRGRHQFERRLRAPSLQKLRRLRGTARFYGHLQRPRVQPLQHERRCRGRRRRRAQGGEQ